MSFFLLPLSPFRCPLLPPFLSLALFPSSMDSWCLRGFRSKNHRQRAAGILRVSLQDSTQRCGPDFTLRLEIYCHNYSEDDVLGFETGVKNWESIANQMRRGSTFSAVPHPPSRRSDEEPEKTSCHVPNFFLHYSHIKIKSWILRSIWIDSQLRWLIDWAVYNPAIWFQRISLVW